MPSTSDAGSSWRHRVYSGTKLERDPPLAVPELSDGPCWGCDRGRISKSGYQFDDDQASEGKLPGLGCGRCDEWCISWTLSLVRT